MMFWLGFGAGFATILLACGAISIRLFMKAPDTAVFKMSEHPDEQELEKLRAYLADRSHPSTDRK